MMVAYALIRHQEKGKKALAVLTALLWRFHNAATGKCFPRYTKPSPRPPAPPGARCTRRSAPLTRSASCPGVNHIKRVREYVPRPVRQPGATMLRGAGSPAALPVAWALARYAGKAATDDEEAERLGGGLVGR